ncbi:hypothetical protein [Pedobacter gandavensis]|uniref:hypothetical protein n=1 Tax=Pedobacter gandavensis TaxID=2679963 RepID=UPI00292CEDD1|nr:hypothetical protein [Pedobacter gandavensis]
MDLQNEWNQLNKELIANAGDREIGAEELKTASISVLSLLKKNLYIKFLWARGISISFFIGLIFTDAPLKYCFLALILAYELGIYFAKQQMKTIRYDLNYADATKSVLSEQLQAIKQTLKIERIWGLIMIPFAGPTGFIMIKIAKGKEASELFTDPKMLTIIFLLMLLGIPLIYLAEKMNKVAFGKYLAKLESQLQQMEN